MKGASDSRRRRVALRRLPTAIGILVSTFTRTQVAALFATAVLTLVPASSFSGLTDPVSSLEGFGRLVGERLPDRYYITISRGTFSKALGFDGLLRVRSSPC